MVATRGIPMLRHLSIMPAFLPLLLVSGGCWAADQQRTVDGPWTETFTMEIKDSERTFVVHNGASYLVTKPEDFTDRAFLLEKDVMVAAKFERGQSDHVSLYGLEDIDVRASAESWSTKLDGDNLYVFGHMSSDPETGKPALRVAGIEPAPSDMQVIAARMKDIAKDDWEDRLAVAAWARDQGATQGNKEFWLQAADDLLTKIITDAATQAESKKDFPLVLKAIDWAVDLQHDAIRAGRIGSAVWIRAHGGKEAEEVSKRMHRLGFEFYREQWRPRAEALGLEYDDRFAAIPWKDADGFYKLGRWADSNAETLPQAKDRSYRAYQAGAKANPDHPGIRRELGLDVAGADDASTSGADAGQRRYEYKDSETGILVRSPPGWRRAESSRDGVRWEDPNSDTSYITVRFLPASTAAIDDLWSSLTAPVRALPGFAAASEDAPERQGGKIRVLRYSFSEGHLTRFGQTVLVTDDQSRLGLVSEASFIDEEKDKALKALADSIERIDFPKNTGDKDAKSKGKGDVKGKGAHGKKSDSSEPETEAEPAAK